MTHRILFLVSFLLFVVNQSVLSQCIADIDQDTIWACEGETVLISVDAACGILLQDDFDNGTMGSGWASHCNPAFSNPCPPTNPPASLNVC